MNSSENLTGKEKLVKASSLNRVIAKSIDLLIIIALLEILQKIGYFAGLIYLLISDGLFDGRSLGKRLIGLKVVHSDRLRACSYRESIIRNLPFAVGYIFFGLLKNVPLIGWIFSIVFFTGILSLEGLIMLGNEKGMRFGDEIANTQVLEESGEE